MAKSSVPLHQQQFPRSVREANFMRHAAGLPVFLEESQSRFPVKTFAFLIGLLLLIDWMCR